MPPSPSAHAPHPVFFSQLFLRLLFGSSPPLAPPHADQAFNTCFVFHLLSVYLLFAMAAAADYSSSSDDDFPEDEEDLFLGGDQGTLGLFASSQVRFPSASACLQDARDKQGFDLSALCRRLRLDCFGVIRLVNYLRSAEGCQAGPRAVMAAESDEAWRDDRFMKPVRMRCFLL